MSEDLKLVAPGPTHADLVERAATWLRNQMNCRVVLAEPNICGEIPDAIGWKYAYASHLVECKVSRCDFFADRAKSFRVDMALGMGIYRYFMVPAGLICLNDLDASYAKWGLLEVKGRCVRVSRWAEAQLEHDRLGEIGLLVQGLAYTQMRIAEPLHKWIVAPDSPIGRMREQRRRVGEQDRASRREAVEDHKRNLDLAVATRQERWNGTSG